MTPPTVRHRRTRRQGRPHLGSALPLAFSYSIQAFRLFPKIKQVVAVRRAQHGTRRHAPVRLFVEPTWILTQLLGPSGEPEPRARITLRGTPQDMRRRKSRRHGLPTIGNFFKTSVAGLVTYNSIRLRGVRDVTWHRYPTQGHSTLQHTITIKVSPDGLVPKRLGWVQGRRLRIKRHVPIASLLADALAHTGVVPSFGLPARLAIRSLGVRKHHAHRIGAHASTLLNLALGHAGGSPAFGLPGKLTVRRALPPRKHTREKRAGGNPRLMAGALAHSGQTSTTGYDFHHYYA